MRGTLSSRAVRVASLFFFIALCGAASQTAIAQTTQRYCWIDAKTGEPVSGTDLVPRGARSNFSTPDEAHGGGRNFVRVPCPPTIEASTPPEPSPPPPNKKTKKVATKKVVNEKSHDKPPKAARDTTTPSNQNPGMSPETANGIGTLIGIGVGIGLGGMGHRGGMDNPGGGRVGTPATMSPKPTPHSIPNY
jgi:hypothetical protein